MGDLNQAQLESPLSIICSGYRVVEGKLLFYNGGDPRIYTCLLNVGQNAKVNQSGAQSHRAVSETDEVGIWDFREIFL